MSRCIEKTIWSIIWEEGSRKVHFELSTGITRKKEVIFDFYLQTSKPYYGSLEELFI